MSGATEKARIEAELVGGQQVVQEAGKIDAALGKVGATASGKLGGAFKAVGGAVAGLAGQALNAAGILQTLNLAAAVEDAKRLDLATAKLGQSAGVAGSQLKAGLEAIERKTLTSAPAMADLARSLGKATYDGRFAAESIGALGDEALALGRDLGDEMPLAAALHGIGTESKSVEGELGRLRDMAERVGTVGGPAALKDTFAALGPLLSGVATDSDEARAKLEALVAVLGKGLKPQQAQAVGGAALSTIRSRALDIERVTGRRVIDDNGQLVDPGKALADLKRIAERRFGKNKEAQRRALMSDFGQELGLAIYRTDFGDVDKLAASAKDTGKTKAEAEKFRQSKEGQRIDTQIQKDAGTRAVGEKVAGIHDSLVNTLGVPGAVGVELVGGKLALAGAKALGSKALSAGGAALGTGAGLGLAAAGGVALAGAAGTVAVLSDIGEDREAMGKRYRSQHAQTLGAELASQAVRAGDLTPVIGRAGGDKEVIAAAMELLSAKFDTLNTTLQGQAQAYADAVGKKTLRIAAPVDPNAGAQQ